MHLNKRLRLGGGVWEEAWDDLSGDLVHRTVHCDQNIVLSMLEAEKSYEDNLL